MRFASDLTKAYDTLRDLDDGRNFPIRPFWMEEAQRFAGSTDHQAAEQQEGPTRPVLVDGVATIASQKFECLQRYFSRRIHSAARDKLIQDAKALAERPTESFMPVTGEPATRAYSRLMQLQGPLSGAFLKDIPMSHRSFWDDQWTMISCFRSGIPFLALPNDPWGDEALKSRGAFAIQRHDQVRDELVRCLTGIRGFCAHTECRVPVSNLFTDITVFAGLRNTSVVTPLELDVHVHHFDASNGRAFYNDLRRRENRKKSIYEEACRRQGRTFLPVGFTVFGALSEGTTELLSRVADAAHQQGYVGEVWGTLKGDRVRAMHGLFRKLSFALNKCSATQLVHAQETAHGHYVRRSCLPRRHYSWSRRTIPRGTNNLSTTAARAAPSLF